MRRRRYLAAASAVSTGLLSGCVSILGESSGPLHVTSVSTSSRTAPLVLKVTVENTTDTPYAGQLVAEIVFSDLDRTETEQKRIVLDGGSTRTFEFAFLFTSAVEGEAYEPDARITDVETVTGGARSNLSVSGPVQSASASGGWPGAYYSNRNTNHNPETAGPTADPSVVWESEVTTPISPGPVVGDDAVFAGPGPTALDRDTAERLWTFRSQRYGLPALADGRLYISTDEAFYAVDAETGEVSWEAAARLGTPVVADGMVFVGYRNVRDTETSLAALDKKTGAEVWVRDDVGNTRAPPAIAGSNVLFPTSTGLVALDRETGKTNWTGRQPIGFAGSVAVAYGVAYVVPPGNDELVARNAADGGYYWSVSLPSSGRAQPAIGHEKVVVPRTDAVVAVDAADGTIEWRVPIDGGGTSVPTIAGELVYVGSENGTLYALDVATGETVFTYDTRAAIRGTTPVAAGQLYLNVDGDRFVVLE